MHDEARDDHSRTDHRRAPATVLLACIALVTASLVPLASALAQPPKPSDRLAAVFAPWSSPEEVITAVGRSGGRLLRVGYWDTVVIVQDPRPGLAARLRRAGAWLVLDPLVASGCFPPPAPLTKAARS